MESLEETEAYLKVLEQESESFQTPRYEIQDPSTRNDEGSHGREPTFKIRVLNVDRSQTHFLSSSMTISRENSSEKEFHVVEEQIFKSLSILLIIRAWFKPG